MFCPECGKEIADGAVVCPFCAVTIGADVAGRPAETAQPEPDSAREQAGTEGAKSDETKREKKKLSKKTLILIAAAAVLILIIALAAVLLGVFSSKNFGKTSDQTVLYTALTNDRTLIVPVQTPSDTITLEGTLQRVFSNPDESVGGIVLGTDNVLYRIEKGKESFIEESVADVFYSVDGSGLAFTTGTYRFDNTERRDLYLRNGAKNERISRDCVGDARFSPNGNNLLYVEYDGKNYTLLQLSGKKAKEVLSSKRRIVAIGMRDDGRRMYYAVKDANGDDLPGDYTLYHYDGESFDELGSISYGNRILLNRDLSQILFVDGKNAWFSENGAEAVKLRMGGDTLYPVMPGETAVQTAGSSLAPDICDAKDFRNTFVLCDETLYLFTGEEFKTISRKVLDARLLDNEKTLLIQKTDGGLYRMNGRKENAKEEELTADDIDLYGFSGNGKTVYYISKNGELFLYRKKGEPVLLSGESGVSAYVDGATGRITHEGQIAYRESSDQLFFVQEGMLYVSAKGEAASAPDYGMEGDVVRVLCYRDLVEVTTLADGVCRVYLSTDGTTFTLLTDEGAVSE